MDEVLKESPRNAEARIAKARMLLVEGKAEEAQVHAQEAVNADRGVAVGALHAGSIALERRDLAAAEERVPRSGQAEPARRRRAIATGATATRARGRGRRTSAAEEVARQRPNDPDAAVLVSRSLRAQGDLARAEREISARLAQNPQAASLHLEMGNVALQRRQTAAARGAYEQALRLQPSLHEARVGLITADIAETQSRAAQTASPNGARRRRTTSV